MNLKTFLMAAAAVSMTAAPAMAANPAAPLSVAKAARASAKPGQSQLEGNGLLIAGIAVAAVVVGIILISDGDSKSP